MPKARLARRVSVSRSPGRRDKTVMARRMGFRVPWGRAEPVIQAAMTASGRVCPAGHLASGRALARAQDQPGDRLSRGQAQSVATLM